MSSDNSVLVKFGVQLDDLFKGLSEAQSAVKEQTGQMKESLESLMGVVEYAGKAFGTLAVIAGGGKMFKEAVSAVKEVTSEAKSMGKVLGVTTTEASIFNVGLASVGASSDQAQQALVMMTRTLNSAPDRFKELGVAIKDSNGEMRPTQEILLDVNNKFAHMADGTQKNIDMQAIFGRSWMNVGPVLQMTAEKLEEAKEHAEALNLVVGVENERDTKAFKISQTALKEALEGVQKTIGEAVMPLFTELSEWLASVGPAAVTVTKYAIGGLVAVLQGLKFVVFSVWEGIKAFIESAVIGFMTLGDVLEQIFEKHSLSGAKQVWESGWDQLKDVASSHLDAIDKEAQKTGSQITQLFSKQTATKMKKGEAAPNLKPEGNAKEKSEMSKWEAENNAAKSTYELEHQLKERSLADDVAFWAQKAALATTSAEDRVKAEAKMRAAELALMKKAAADQKALTEENIAATEKAGLDALALAKVDYDKQEALGNISKSQMIDQEERFENARFNIMVAAQKAREQLVADDPNHSAAALQKEKDKMLEVERAHQLKLSELSKNKAVEDAKYQLDFMKGLENGFATVIADTLKGTQSLTSIIKNLFDSVVSALIGTLSKMAAEWAINLLKEKVIGNATALSQISANAGVAGSAAVASTAAIPVTGPELAPAAGAAAYSAAMGFASLASASKGFDIPAGMNPITQLHEKEMVLPAAQADVIRNMAGNGGGNGDMHIHIQALDGQSVARVFRDNGQHLVAALKQQRRNFAF